ncbi:hypothetical protein [Pedobacter yulinensis]|nr:hypothetical protein [Pedobacter yulinensis]
MAVDRTLLNHEKIHLRQQLEMLVIPFYLVYLALYLANRLRGQAHHTAYRNIAFEREAFAYDNHVNYLDNRPFFAWSRFLQIPKK